MRGLKRVIPAQAESHFFDGNLSSVVAAVQAIVFQIVAIPDLTGLPLRENDVLSVGWRQEAGTERGEKLERGREAWSVGRSYSSGPKWLAELLAASGLWKRRAD